MAHDWDAIRREYEQTPIALNELAEKYGIKYPTIKSRKQRQGWMKNPPLDASQDAKKDATSAIKDASSKRRGPPLGSQNAKGHGAPKGNKNALGNNGGAPKGNKNAVTTGEYETIWFDTLTAEEQQLFGKINTNTLAQVEEGIIFLTFRERRMMERISKLMAGLSESELRVLSELREEKELVKLYDPKIDDSKHVWVPIPKMMVTQITETKARCIDDILKIEEALTRVQTQKARFIALKHSIESAAKGEGGDTAKEHARRLQEVWANRR